MANKKFGWCRNSHCSSGNHTCGCPFGPQVRLKTRRGSLLFARRRPSWMVGILLVRPWWDGGSVPWQWRAGCGMSDIGIHAWPLLEHVGWRGCVEQWSRDGGRGWVGFGGTPRAAMGCRAVLHPQFFCESTGLRMHVSSPPELRF